MWSQNGETLITYDREFPANWPPELCQAQLSAKYWETMDLRMYRHQPQVRTTIWGARRATAKAFRDMRSSFEAEQAKLAEKNP